MKARMRTVYVVHNHGVEWEGDCPRWANEGRRAGNRVTEIRVLWVGKASFCIACHQGNHHKAD